jgi:hypothetical protein
MHRVTLFCAVFTPKSAGSSSFAKQTYKNILNTGIKREIPLKNIFSDGLTDSLTCRHELAFRPQNWSVQAKKLKNKSGQAKHHQISVFSAVLSKKPTKYLRE